MLIQSDGSCAEANVLCDPALRLLANTIRIIAKKPHIVAYVRMKNDKTDYNNTPAMRDFFNKKNIKR